MANSLESHNININKFRLEILEWYEKHQRQMPWRADTRLNQKPNPYYVWLSEIMLQQTTVVTVKPYFLKFIEKWPTIHDLAKADREEVMHEWAGLGYYARARNLHKCAQMVSQELNGTFPETQAELEKLPGIGAYTSAALRSIAFAKDSNVVDGNIERVMARLYAITEPMPQSKNKLKAHAENLSINRNDKPGEYAQALMDLGATICTPKSPKCSLCPIQKFCKAYEKDIAETLPIKIKKKAKPQKKGIVYWVLNEKNEVLFMRRDENVMLGGMLGLPTSKWVSKSQKLSIFSGFKPSKQFITHSFTHFDLKLEIFVCSQDKSIVLPENNPIWVSLLEVDQLGLPTLFKKVVKMMK